jgi:hypothetical protein
MTILTKYFSIIDYFDILMHRETIVHNIDFGHTNRPKVASQ